MRRSKTIALLILYGIVFILTIVLEYISILNPEMRLLVNGCTILMATVGGILFWILFRGVRQDNPDSKKEDEIVFDKQTYIEYANAHELTRREAEIGLLIANGYTNLQIAETLYIAETTVKKHATHIYEKANVAGRKEFKQAIQGLMEET